MRIGIVGYGVMGKLVAKAVLDRGHSIAAIVDHATSNAHYKNLAEITTEQASEIDVLIDFSSPETALENIQQACRLNKPIVMATTGWYEKLEEARDIVTKSGIGMVWGSNFSVGVNLFWQVLERASQLLANQNDYDVFVHEFHHKRKKDSPSGTAITTANKILANYPRKTKMITQTLDRAISEEELHVTSTRGGAVPGTHQVYFDSAFDTIEINHTARTRDGFAVGAVMAAEWIQNQNGFYAFDEIFNEIANFK